MLLHLIRPAKTKEMILLTEKVPAEKCLRWGLAEQEVPDGTTLEAAEAMAEKILKKPPLTTRGDDKAGRDKHQHRSGSYRDLYGRRSVSPDDLHGRP